MSGKWITKQQVKIYMKARSDNQTQTVSAAKAGVSVRSARAIEQGKRPDPKAQRRHWRTRPDPLAKVWTSVLEPMLEATPQYQALYTVA